MTVSMISQGVSPLPAEVVVCDPWMYGLEVVTGDDEMTVEVRYCVTVVVAGTATVTVTVADGPASAPAADPGPQIAAAQGQLSKDPAKATGEAKLEPVTARREEMIAADFFMV